MNSIKLCFKSIGGLLVVMLGFMTSMSYAGSIYLVNEYGAPIKYTLKSPAFIDPEDKGIYLNDNRPVPVGFTENLKRGRYGKGVEGLNISIRTSGGGSQWGMSPWHDLESEIMAILRKVETFPEFGNKNAYIFIHETSSWNPNWNITVDWR
jgi:hypothetical protein